MFSVGVGRLGARHDSHFDDFHRHLHGAGRGIAWPDPAFGGWHQRLGIRDRGAHRADLPDPLQRRVDAAARSLRRRRPDRRPVARHRRPCPPGRRIRTAPCRRRGPGGIGELRELRPDPGRGRRDQRTRRAGQAARGLGRQPRRHWPRPPRLQPRRRQSSRISNEQTEPPPAAETAAPIVAKQAGSRSRLHRRRPLPRRPRLPRATGSNCSRR